MCSDGRTGSLATARRSQSGDSIPVRPGIRQVDTFRLGDDPLMTKEEGSVQLADAAWTLCGAFAKSHFINSLTPAGRRRTMPLTSRVQWDTGNLPIIPFLRRFNCSGVGLLTDEG